MHVSVPQGPRASCVHVPLPQGLVCSMRGRGCTHGPSMYTVRMQPPVLHFREGAGSARITVSGSGSGSGSTRITVSWSGQPHILGAAGHKRGRGPVGKGCGGTLFPAKAVACITCKGCSVY